VNSSENDGSKPIQPLMEVRMNVLSPTRLVSIAFAAAALAGCAGLPQPYSQIEGHKYFPVPIDTYPVQIVRIDGHDTLDTRVFVDPGLRQVTVQAPPDGAHRFGGQRTLALEVAPCTRYYLVAVKDNRLASDFTVKVDYQEPIGGCSTAAPK
jgi:hypothetical protein